MRVSVVIAVCLSLPAVAGGHRASLWGAGAFNSNYQPPGAVAAHTPDWRAYPPSWRGAVTSPNARHAAPVMPIVPYYVPSYYPYGSPYYGFQPTQPEPAPPEPARAPAPVVIFEHPQP